jgi:hypothetical protein
MNIIPRRVASLGEGLGLEFKSAYGSCDDPFGINVNLYEGKMEWQIYYDKRFIAEEEVERLLKDIKLGFLQLVKAHLQPELTVGEILELLGNGMGNDTETKKSCDELS